MDSEGSRRLILAAIQHTVEGRCKETEREALGLWSAEEEAMLGVLPDREVAARTGRTLDSVRGHRRMLGRENPDLVARRNRPGLPWAFEEDGMVVRLPAVEVAERTGRPLTAVRKRRHVLRKLLLG